MAHVHPATSNDDDNNTENDDNLEKDMTPSNDDHDDTPEN